MSETDDDAAPMRCQHSMLPACAQCSPELLLPFRAHALVDAAAERLGGQHRRCAPLPLLAERRLPGNPNAESHKATSQHLVEASISNQIGHPDSLVAPVAPVRDLEGGFVLSGSPRPTAGASSLRPALALALMAGNGWIPSTDRKTAWQQALALAVRFARQLQVDAAQELRSPSPDRARGGVKSAPWSTSRASTPLSPCCWRTRSSPPPPDSPLRDMIDALGKAVGPHPGGLNGTSCQIGSNPLLTSWSWFDILRACLRRREPMVRRAIVHGRSPTQSKRQRPGR